MSEAGARLYEELMRFRPEGMTANAWAVRAGVSRTIWADLRRHGNPSRRTLSKLLEAAGSSLAEFEALRIGASPRPASLPGFTGVGEAGSHGWRQAPLAPVPVLATSVAGEWAAAGSGIEMLAVDRSTAIGTADRPAALAADPAAYAVNMVGESMWPRFRSGRRLLISPAAPIVAGDDVLVQLTADKVLIKELVARSANRLDLRQFNPDVTFAVQIADVAAVHKVAGEAI